MADTAYGVNHPLAVKAWSRRLMYEVPKESYVGKFLGSGDTAIIQRKNELSKGPGDRVRVGLRMLLTGDGVLGDSVLENNEEALTTYSMDVFIDQLRHAVRSTGKMSEQRVPFSVREEAYMALKDWWTERLERVVANHLTGNIAQTDMRYAGANTISAPDASHSMFANSEGTEASMSNGANWQFNLTMLDRAVNRAKTLNPKIRPTRINGKEYYAAVLHPNQVTQMRTQTNTGQWLDIQKAAMAMADATDSPIFNGALGIYNGVVLHEWSYLPAFASTNTNISGNVYRAVLCGAQAAVMAVGNDGDSTNWAEETYDYGNKLGVMAGMIFGVRKTVYNSLDFATITMSSWSPSP